MGTYATLDRIQQGCCRYIADGEGLRSRKMRQSVGKGKGSIPAEPSQGQALRVAVYVPLVQDLRAGRDGDRKILANMKW